MLARLFVFFGGLLVLLLTAAMVGPYFIDWTSYRADFEREASAVLGRRVTVEGDATARLLRLADGPDEVHRNQLGRLELRRHAESGTVPPRTSYAGSWAASADYQPAEPDL